MNVKRQLLIFTRYPEPGKTKTRMIPALGEKGAAELHRLLAEHAIRTVKDCLDFLSPVIYYRGGTEEKIRSWLGDRFSYRSQRGSDLGEIMRNAFEEGFATGAGEIVAIGTDCPDLTPPLLQEAFDRLRGRDLVLGPAGDGGYYLIGLKRVYPELFESIDWGTATVLATTKEKATRLGLSVAYLAELNDIDRPEDLPEIDRFPDLRLHDYRGSHLDEIE
ncbi:TIGR04282 family arsenosugar biosynthesis glycosyltransferase [Pannus brasiliensis CCIBt3594]|uniref:TIGR04282 family arsenosugar biosynthesis glycosyltransferase n=1 Tax=Pannus brasiliensis CCIBt3594 TaxID=1427578 RepID=A0AAW9QTA6_9CHRO